MKEIILINLLFMMLSLNAQQNNGKNIDVAKGKEILELLPKNMLGQGANEKDDKVVKSRGAIGVVVHRSYSSALKLVAIEVINNSFSVDYVRAALERTPGNNNQRPDDNTPKSKVIQVNGYKALLQPFIGEAIKTGYELLIPLETTLITMKAFNYTEDDFLKMSSTIPVALIEQKLK